MYTAQLNLHAIKYFVLGEKGPLRHLLYYDLACFVFVCAAAAALLLSAWETGALDRGTPA